LFLQHSTFVIIFCPENHRIDSFKKRVDSKAGRLRRDELTLQIRKQKKDQRLKKKRSQQIYDTNESVPGSATLLSKKVTADDIPRLADIIMGTSAGNDKAEATKHIRRLVSKEQHPPVCRVLQSGLLPYLVHNLTADPRDESLIFESAWALTNIASLDHGSEVASSGAIPPLVQLMGHISPNIREQSMWCLGNIAGEGIVTRDAILSHDPIPNL
jgi:hypothetical protein